MSRAALLIARSRAVGAGPVSDAFNRADNTSSLGNADTGQVWAYNAAGSGQFGIASNKAYPVTNVDNMIARIDVGGTDATVTCDITVSAKWTGIIARASSDFLNFYKLDISPINGYRLTKHVSGTETSLGTAGTGTNGTTYTAQLIVSGTSLIAKINGSTVLSLTDASLTTGTGVGLRYGTNIPSDSGARWDNFTASTP